MATAKEVRQGIPATELMATVAKEIELAFHDAKPMIISREGQTQEPLSASHVAVELASLDWANRGGIFEGTLRDGSEGKWIGTIREDGLSLVNVGVRSANGLEVISSFLPNPDKGLAGTLNVTTEKGRLLYTGTLV